MLTFLLIIVIFCSVGHSAAEESATYLQFPTLLRIPGEVRFQFRYYRNLKPENIFNSVVHHTLVTTARSCMTHVNATEADLESLRDDPPFPEKAACIIECLLEKIGIVKHKKYSKSGFMMSVTPLVFRNKKKMEHLKSVSENCDKEINRHNVELCQLGNEITTCIFKYAPELHMKS